MNSSKTTESGYNFHAGVWHYETCRFPFEDQAVCNCPPKLRFKKNRHHIPQIPKEMTMGANEREAEEWLGRISLSYNREMIREWIYTFARHLDYLDLLKSKEKVFRCKCGDIIPDMHRCDTCLMANLGNRKLVVVGSVKKRPNEQNQ